LAGGTPDGVPHPETGMANSMTAADDWAYYVTSLVVNAASGKAALKTIIYSDTIRIAQEFHLCAPIYREGTSTEYVFNQLYEGGGDRFSLYNLRGQAGRVELDSEHLWFDARARSGALTFANELRLGAARGDYWFDGMWLLFRVVNYATMSRMIAA
jgi:hypothetical protein